MRRSAFTLIELLVVIAITEILSVVVMLTLNPAELLRQSRDSTRIADMGTLNTALGIFSEDVGSSMASALGTQQTSVGYFNGSTNVIGVPDNSWLDPAQAVTVTTWFETGLGAATQQLVSKNTPFSASTPYELQLYPTDKIYGNLSLSSGATYHP